MSFLSDVQDIFTGGLSAALQAETDKAVSDINTTPIAADNKVAGMGNNGTLYHAGTTPSLIADVPPVMWIGGGLVAIVLVVLLLRKG